MKMRKVSFRVNANDHVKRDGGEGEGGGVGDK